MKLFKYLFLFSTVTFIFSCTPEETLLNEENSEINNQSTETRMNCTESDYGVTFTINGNSITMDAVNSAVNLLSIHDASDFSVVETLCVPWTSNLPDCGPGIISDPHPDGNYLLKVKTNAGFDWLPFTLPCSTSTTCDPVDVSFPGGGTMIISCIDPAVYRLDVHDLSYGAIASICNPWGAPTYCTNAPITENGLPLGDHLLRVGSPGSVVWIPITIN